MSIICMAAFAVLLVIGSIQQYTIYKQSRKRGIIGHDALTGLCNLEHLAEKTAAYRRDRRPRLVIYINIAEFKLFNELFGREKGNEILTELADEIRHAAAHDTVSAGDTEEAGSSADERQIPVMTAGTQEKSRKVAGRGEMLYGRISADSFVIISDDRAYAESVMRQLHESMEKRSGSPNYKLRIYFGIYETADFDEPLASMCDKASVAADSIKNDAQEYKAYYDEAMIRAALKQKLIIDEFEEAMRNNEFKMYLQPQFSAVNGELIGAEALVRRIRQDGSIVPPAEFIPIYEKAGIICRIDRFMWEQAAAKIAEWKNKGITRRISVNISPKDFYYMDVCAEIAGITAKYGIPASLLNVEITETALMSAVPGLREGMSRLRELGFTVEIDDFGSGYSSLSALKDIDADVLKIDMGFLRKTENSERGRIILDTVINMAKQLEMAVITEGIETVEQARGLSLMGCDYFQGYFFSKPISTECFERRYVYGCGDLKHISKSGDAGETEVA